MTTTWAFRSELEPDVFSRDLPLIFPRVDPQGDGLTRLAAETEAVVGDGGAVTLRIEATDTRGATVTQVVQNATRSAEVRTGS